MLDRAHVGVFEPLGQLRELQGLIPILLGRFPVRPNGGKELDAEFHRSPHGAAPQADWHADLTDPLHVAIHHSPGTTGPTPSGVPVMMTSPGRSV